MYNIEKLYQSKRFKLIGTRIAGKKQTAGILCFQGSPTWHDLTGKTVCAIEDGVVVASTRCYNPQSREYRRGRIVEIAGAQEVHITYGRLACAYVREGEYVHAGQPIGVEGNTGAGAEEYLALEFRRNGRRVDGCELLGIDCDCPREWVEDRSNAPERLINAYELLTHAVKMTGEHGSIIAVPVRYIMAAPIVGGGGCERERKV